ncbi:MAG: protocatechuate 3,4-dioxygenase [Acidobacteriota bacterium]
MSEQSLQRMPRRSFLKHASVFVLALPALEVGALGLLGCNRLANSQVSTTTAPEDGGVPSKVVIVSEKEPGEPMIISGTIFAPDGKTPLPGINLFVYQTDATGVYSSKGGNNRSTRIHGLVRSGPDGSYEFRTIKPAPYPAARNPAHIHASVYGAGYPEYWIDEFLFEDDPFLKEEDQRKYNGQGRLSAIVKLQRGSDGILRGVRDIQVERCSERCIK